MSARLRLKRFVVAAEGGQHAHRHQNSGSHSILSGLRVVAECLSGTTAATWIGTVRPGARDSPGGLVLRPAMPLLASSALGRAVLLASVRTALLAPSLAPLWVLPAPLPVWVLSGR